MGGQAYLTRLAFGRSAYEPLATRSGPDHPERPQQPSGDQVEQREAYTRAEDRNAFARQQGVYIQQFDHRGHPQNSISQELSRQSRRAQNDVLATVGVLLGPDQRYQAIVNLPIAASDRAKFEVLVDETKNETSSGGLAKAFIIVTSSWLHDRAAFLRNRMQVFPFYSGLPFLEILKTEWTFSRPLTLLFKGTPGDLLEMGLEMLSLGSMGRWLYDRHVVARISQITSPSLRYLLGWIAAIAKTSAQLCFLSISATLRCHAALQVLGILPLRPFFPSMMAFVPFSTASIIRPLRWPQDLTVGSSLELLASFAASPLVLHYIERNFINTVFSKQIDYFRCGVPKPDNPDDVAIAVALMRQQDASNVSGLDFLIKDGTYELEKDVHTVRELVERDWVLARNTLRTLPTWCRSFFVARAPTPNSPLPQIEQQTENYHSYLTYRSSGPAQGQQSPARPDGLPASHEQRRLGLSNHGLAARGVHEGINWVHPASWEIITSQEPSAGVEVVYDLSKVHRKLHDSSRPTHHVTHLTSCMADTLAFYLSVVVTHIVWLPFETLFLRSIAWAYLDTDLGASSSASWLRNEIYPQGSWFGAGLRGGGALDYARRIALSLGLEAALGFGTWQLGAGLTWWLGTSRYKWGKL